MEEIGKNSQPAVPEDRNGRREESLVDRLCKGDHSVEVGLGPVRTAKLFQEAIDREYVHIRFTQTRGGTELGFRLDREKSDFSKADFCKGIGTVHVEGSLTLDYVRVRCIADIDLGTLAGRGQLMKLEGEKAPAA